MKDRLIKAITVLIFVSLILGFVAYKSGYFGNKKSVNGSSSKDSEDFMLKDTIPEIDSLIKFNLLPSSKVLILRGNTRQAKDTLIIDSIKSK